VIVEPGGAVTICGYPREAFPPTDFHSATLVGDAIVIIGNLSYVGNRQPGLTQVCRLVLATLAIEPVQTVGEMPGWIHRHAATLTDDGTTIVVRGGQVDVGRDRAFVENIDEWALDLASLSWTRRTALDWQHFTLVRADGRMNCLWDLRQALWHADHPDARQGVDYAARLREHTARDPDLELVRTLYQFDGATVEPQREGDDYNLHRVRIDGIDVRFTENSYRIAAMVEGTLDEARLGAVQRALQGTLEQLENAAWRLEPSE
jgi:hypothetical protein